MVTKNKSSGTLIWKKQDTYKSYKDVLIIDLKVDTSQNSGHSEKYIYAKGQGLIEYQMKSKNFSLFKQRYDISKDEKLLISFFKKRNNY